MRIFLKNNKGVPSVSLTMTVIAFTITTIIFLASSIESIGTFKFRAFDAASTSAYLIPILGLYFGRKATHREEK